MTKTFMQDGKWVDRNTRPDVLLCSCGNKYLKTRPRQTVCLYCIAAASHRH